MAHDTIMTDTTNNSEYDFYTIGYQKLDIATFIDRLKDKNVKTLIDIRKHAFSNKPEFMQNNLRTSLEKRGIAYIHLPDLGVDSQHRKNLNTEQDYQKLWDLYDTDVVPKVKSSHVLEVLNTCAKPYALMCMEHDPAKCHRHRLAKALEMDDNKRSLDLC